MSRSDYRTLLNHGRKAGLNTREMYSALATRPLEAHMTPATAWATATGLFRTTRKRDGAFIAPSWERGRHREEARLQDSQPETQTTARRPSLRFGQVFLDFCPCRPKLPAVWISGATLTGGCLPRIILSGETMGRFRKLSLIALVWATAVSTVVAGVPRTVCRCQAPRWTDAEPVPAEKIGCCCGVQCGDPSTVVDGVDPEDASTVKRGKSSRSCCMQRGEKQSDDQDRLSSQTNNSRERCPGRFQRMPQSIAWFSGDVACRRVENRERRSQFTFWDGAFGFSNFPLRDTFLRKPGLGGLPTTAAS